MKILKQAQTIVTDGEIIHLTYFGSKLYGTAHANSDTDVKGIFIPSKRALLANNITDSFRFATNTEKNTKDDFDFECWSIHKLFRLLKVGDTNAFDILFSGTNKKSVLKTSDMFKYIFTGRHLFLSKNNLLKGNVGYVFRQLKRFACKGSNLFVINFVYEYLSKVSDTSELNEHVDAMIEQFKKEIVAFSQDESGDKNEEKLRVVYSAKGEKFLEVNRDKKFMFNQRVKQILPSLLNWKNSYGERSKLSLESGGVDAKAISHAWRSIMQTKELLTGDIKFPLKGSKELLKVKLGDFDFEHTVSMLEDKILQLESDIKTSNLPDEVDVQKIDTFLQTLLFIYGY